MTDDTGQAWDPKLYDDKHAYVADLARSLIDQLAPQPGERVLDLGCGTGRMTRWLLDAGACVVAIDRDPAMVEAARAACPDADVRCADARELDRDLYVDAVISNATLHWVTEPGRVVAELARVLAPGGRFVAELGGAGNVARVVSGLRFALAARGVDFDPTRRWYFPSIAEYAGVLEAGGFRVDAAELFPRPTRLEDGEAGLTNWYRMFAGPVLDAVPEAKREDVLERAAASCRDQLWRDGAWWADYVRLRIRATRV